MKQFMLRSLRPAMLIMVITMFMVACQNGNDVTPVSKQTATTAASKSQVVTATQDVLGITADAMTSQGISSGRTASGSKPHWGHHDGCKPNITRSFSKIVTTKDSLSYSGSITIDYGQGGTCGGDSTKVYVHKGKIVDAFTFTAVLLDSTVFETSIETITFSGFSRDSLQIDGTIVSTSSGNLTTVELKNVTLTYADGSSVTWSGTLTYTYNNGGTIWDWSDDSKVVTGTLSGTSGDGVAYTNSITSPVTYKYSCLENRIGAPVSGTVELKVGDSTSTVDYGDGTCDKTYTVTIDGVTTSYTFK